MKNEVSTVRSIAGHEQRRQQHRGGEHGEDRGGDQPPDEDRHAGSRVIPGARSVITVAIMLTPDEGQRDPDQGERDQVGVDPSAGLIGQRGVAGPAGGKAAEDDRGQEHEPSQARSATGSVPRSAGTPSGASRSSAGRGSCPAVRAPPPTSSSASSCRAARPASGSCPPGRSSGPALVSSPRMNIAFRPADEEEEQHRDEILDRDHLVVGAEAEVAPGAVLLALAQRRRAGRSCVQPGN